MKELLKFHVYQPLAHAPMPLFMAYSVLTNSFSSLSYRPRKRYYFFRYNLSGYGLFNNNGQISKIVPGSVLFYQFPRDRHYFYYEAGMEPWIGIYLEFDAGDMENALEALIEDYGPVFSVSPDAAGIRQLFDFHKQYKSGSTINIDGLSGSQLIYRLVADIREAGEKKHTSNSFINTFCNYVNDHLNKNITVEEIARNLSVSRGHLTRVFTEQMKVTPHHYIMTLKVRKACMLLGEGEVTNEEIAEQIGCTSSIQFYRLFKRITGMTPGEFRKTSHQEDVIRNL